jgi:hypothetical protein
MANRIKLTLSLETKKKDPVKPGSFFMFTTIIVRTCSDAAFCITVWLLGDRIDRI